MCVDCNTVEVCMVTATMNGTSVTGEHAVRDHFCARANMYIFAIYDADGEYKMTAVPLDQAKTHKEPSSFDKFISGAPDNINIEAVGTVCNMWEGDGYDTKDGDAYDLKDVKVTACGWYMHTSTGSYVNVRACL